MNPRSVNDSNVSQVMQSTCRVYFSGFQFCRIFEHYVDYNTSVNPVCSTVLKNVVAQKNEISTERMFLRSGCAYAINKNTHKEVLFFTKKVLFLWISLSTSP